MLPRSSGRLSPIEITDNLRSISDVPADVLPDGTARVALTWLISTGFDVYCYASGGSTYGTWVCWLQPLCDARPGKDGRVSITEWRERWPELLAEMGIALPAATKGEVQR